MITIGLTGWSDHPLIAPNRQRKLEDYASHFPFVEMDTSFYGIPSEKSIHSWIDKTPDVFQFPPFFHYNQKNIDYLYTVGHQMGALPVAIEFRHPSWFQTKNKKHTLNILKENFFSYTVVDQPQTPGNSIPTLLEVTNSQLA